MRLTLRTLLAYLDDTLDGPQTKQIGEKVAESDVAQELITRMRRVVRKRSLATPAVTGAGVEDPNVVAEYLDNVLSDEAVERVEQNALDSDLHLAEIAACHQILTLVEGEPARVPPTARQRMYKLVKGREAIPYRKPTAPVVASIDPEEVGYEQQEGDRTLLLGLPAYAQQRSPLRRLSPLLGLALLVAALVLVVRQALPPRAGPAEVAEVAPPAFALLPPGRELLPPPHGDPGARPPAPPGKAPEGKPGPAKDRQAPPIPAIPKDEPAAGEKPAPKEAPGAKEKEKPGRPVLPPPPAPPSPRRAAAGKMVSRDTVLLRRPAGAEETGAPWQRVLAAEPVVHTTDELLSLPGYHNELLLDSGVRLTLWGNLPEFLNVPEMESRVVLHAPAEGLDADLTLEEGRVFVSGGRTDRPVHVRVRFDGQVWDVTLADEATEVVLDRIGHYPPGVGFSRQPGGEGPQTEFYVGVLRGTAGVRFGGQEYPAVAAPAMVVWDSKGAGATDPQPLKQVPAFWSRSLPAEGPAREIAQRAEAALHELSRRLSGPGADVSVVLAEAVAEQPRAPADREAMLRTVHLRGLAVYCLQAVGDLASLVDALGDADKPDVRQAAVLALRQWTGGGDDRDLRLHQVLTQKKGYTERDADLVLQLLHSFSEEQVTNPALYSYLIGLLGHEKLAVRELAYWHLVRLDPQVAEDPKKYFFDAAAPADVRQEVQKAWKERIPDGQLPPGLRQ